MAQGQIAARTLSFVTLLQSTRNAVRSGAERYRAQAVRLRPPSRGKLFDALRQHFQSLGQIGGV